MDAISAFKQKALDFQLTPIHIRELLYLGISPCNVYAYTEGLYRKIIYADTGLDINTFKDLFMSNHNTLFVTSEDADKIIETQQDLLRKTLRSLSIGDHVKNGRKALSLLTVNLSYLYRKPTSDTYLSLQYQAVKNLASFLYEHPKIHLELYRDYIKQNHHFVYAQPFISSFFLLGVLKYSKIFNKKESEALFICSYFKDIGMSALSEEKYDEDSLSDEDKQVFSKHPVISADILKGRIPLPPQYLEVIKHHHYISLLDKEVKGSKYLKYESLQGSETMLVCIMDIIAAMISGRPYRKATKLFEALEYIKPYMLSKYPSEFKIMVNYFRQLFKL
jgi:HD-GYP domain-containing protein (c-di-GMP phosphodiesterase class II)